MTREEMIDAAVRRLPSGQHLSYYAALPEAQRKTSLSFANLVQAIRYRFGQVINDLARERPKHPDYVLWAEDYVLWVERHPRGRNGRFRRKPRRDARGRFANGNA